MLNEWATSASMQSRDKDNIISRLHFIFLLAFQLPIRVVDENQNSRPPALFSVRLIFYYLPMQVIEDSFCGWIFNPSIVLFVGGGLHCIIEDKHIFARIFHEVVA